MFVLKSCVCENVYCCVFVCVWVGVFVLLKRCGGGVEFVDVDFVIE